MTSSDSPTTHDLVNEPARPLTEEERKAADRDIPVGERVYAPASERIPREPVPGHRDFVDHPDGGTPERQAAGVSSPAMQANAEPSFTRVPRPSTYPSPSDLPSPERWMSASPAMFPMGIVWAASCAVGVWLFMRWRRERNKPMNRIRRQAEQARRTAYQLRGRVPEIPEQATRPAMGLSTVLLSVAVFLWQQSQSRARSKELARQTHKRARWFGRKAADAVPDTDWQQRLMTLRERWNPGRIELEKISIPKR
jgi:hypothetical protein